MIITVSRGEFKGFKVQLLPPFPSLSVTARVLETPPLSPEDERRGFTHFQPGTFIHLLKHEYELISTKPDKPSCPLIVLNSSKQIYHKQFPPLLFRTHAEANQASPKPHYVLDYEKFKQSKRGAILLRALEIQCERLKKIQLKS